MNTYSVAWLFVCGGLALAGTTAAFAIAIPAMIALFMGAAMLTGVAELNVVVGRGEAQVRLRNILRPVVSGCFLGGATCVTLVGLTAWFGAWVILVVALAAGGSPYALRLYGRWLRRRCATTSPTQRHGPISRTSPTLETSPAARHPAKLRSMSDTDLCHAWRASFTALQEASSPSQRIRIVEARQEYLDEFERRNPEGLLAWLASGARAAANPTRYVVESATLHHRPINWDDLIPRQDK
jgi:hypothetical protein